MERSVVLVNGPVVEAGGLSGAAMHELVEVGPLRLSGEVIRLDGERATVQVYEDTGGLRPGDPVHRTGGPLAVELGPGLLGGIFDGTQRPLTSLARDTGPFIARGARAPALARDRRWEFVPRAAPGTRCAGGEVLGTVQETGAVEHRVLVPPGAAGRLAWLAPPGSHRVDDPIATLEQEGGELSLTMVQRWPVRVPRPVRRRRPPSAPLLTGQRVIDVLFPVARGGAAAIPGGFGTGKTVMQQQLAKWCDAEVIVYVGCGERGNEMTDVLSELPALRDPRTGRPLMERTILIANTSNMPVIARESSIHTGITLAEYYRDMGYDVALMADSTSRWAEALREVAARTQEIPAEEGFPASLPTQLASFYERAGAVQTLSGSEASITLIGSASPPGGDFSEPVTQHTKRFVRTFWALDARLAAARHYPAIDWGDSYSRYADELGDWYRERVGVAWVAQRQEALAILAQADRVEDLARLLGREALPDSERVLLLSARLLREGFLQQNALSPADTNCPLDKQAGLLRMFLSFDRAARTAVDAGVPAARLESLDLGFLVLARETVPPDQPARLAELERRALAMIDELRIGSDGDRDD